MLLKGSFFKFVKSWDCVLKSSTKHTHTKKKPSIPYIIYMRPILPALDLPCCPDLAHILVIARPFPPDHHWYPGSSLTVDHDCTL